MPTLKRGSLAYKDSFAGMVPCKVIAIHKDGVIDYKVTATRGPYQRGEHLTSNEVHRRIVPRDAVRFRKYSTEILPFTVEID